MLSFDALALRLRRHLPVFLQAEAAECGLACLAMIASFHRHHVDVVTLRRRFSVSLKGMDLNQMILIARQLRLDTRAVQLDLDEIRHLALPCVLHWGFNHFVVLKSMTAQGAVIHDPGIGRRHVGFEELSHKFTGVALEIWPGAEFEKKRVRPGIRLLGLMGKISGLRRSLSQILILGLALQLFSLVSPFLLQWTIDYVIVSEDHSLLNTLVLGFTALLFLQILIGSARAWAMMYMSTLFGVQWRSNVLSHMLRLPCQFFEKRHLGDLVSRFAAVDQIQQTLTASFFSVILDGLMALSTLALMFVYSPALTLIAVFTMMLYGLVRWVWYGPLRNATEEQIGHAARQQSHFLETLRGMRTLKLFQKLDLRRSAWQGLFVEQINAGLRSQKLQLLYQQVNALLFGMENLVVIWLGATMVMESQFSVGMFMAFYSYRTQFDGRVGSLIDRTFDVRMLQLHGARLADIVLEPPEDDGQGVGDTGLALELRSTLEVRGLSYRYSDQEPWILHDLDFHIAEGESVAIIGPSGGGKSTLCKVLLGILPATQGSIRMFGRDVSSLGGAQLRGLTGCVMQDDALFAGTLTENICFFDPQPQMSWLVECARMAGIHDEIESMPMGYHTLVGDMGTVLSGGQKQRVLLARALYKKPRILFLDEATSHLDTECERQVNAAIRGLNITRIIVAHRPETIASADRVIELLNGRVRSGGGCAQSSEFS
ncbi:peptidase domain-containing ABC transporter [Achromobacter aegrifaciens]|uniref:peptidase domain-containing ABC transporter n=1 Tax=Achromobacter aegrifaciens TaxID=1287736 RepID=UPI0028AFA7AD|nr:peptidase domain-containing ABC transporter [Achromobacter aegrifaciens]